MNKIQSIKEEFSLIKIFFEELVGTPPIVIPDSLPKDINEYFNIKQNYIRCMKV